MTKMLSFVRNGEMGGFVWVAAFAFYLISSPLVAVPADAAPAHDNWAAATDGGELPPCPSMYRCRVQ